MGEGFSWGEFKEAEGVCGRLTVLCGLVPQIGSKESGALFIFTHSFSKAIAVFFFSS